MREPSAGSSPPTAFNVDGEACSVAAARGTTFVRPHCAPRITKVHSAAACAAPAQSPSAALNGYDGTALFYHAAYAASYTACLSYVAGDATSYARFHPDKTAPGHDGRRAPGAGKGAQREISFACDAIMYEQYVILYYIVGPTCRGPNSCVRAPLRYKREALAVHKETSRQTQALATLSLSWEGNTTHSGRRVLRSGGPNHSKSRCVHRVLE